MEKMNIRDATAVGIPIYDRVKIFFDFDIYQQIANQIKENQTQEVGGLLIGDFLKEDNQYYLHIVAFIKFKTYANHKDETLSLNHETLQDAIQEAGRMHSSHKVLGWYHTQPGFGIFLSGHHLSTHEKLFRFGYQIFYMIDPINRKDGFFYWEENHLKKASGYYFPGVVSQEIWELDRSSLHEDAQSTVIKEVPPSFKGKTEASTKKELQEIPVSDKVTYAKETRDTQETIRSKTEPSHELEKDMPKDVYEPNPKELSQVQDSKKNKKIKKNKSLAKYKDETSEEKSNEEKSNEEKSKEEKSEEKSNEGKSKEEKSNEDKSHAEPNVENMSESPSSSQDSTSDQTLAKKILSQFMVKKVILGIEAIISIGVIILIFLLWRSPMIKNIGTYFSTKFHTSDVKIDTQPESKPELKQALLQFVNLHYVTQDAMKIYLATGITEFPPEILIKDNGSQELLRENFVLLEQENLQSSSTSNAEDAGQKKWYWKAQDSNQAKQLYGKKAIILMHDAQTQWEYEILLTQGEILSQLKGKRSKL